MYRSRKSVQPRPGDRLKKESTIFHSYITDTVPHPVHPLPFLYRYPSLFP